MDIPSVAELEVTPIRPVAWCRVGQPHWRAFAPAALPLTIEGAADAVLLDFGRQLVGRPRLSLAGRVRVDYGEVLREVLRDEPSPVHWYHQPSDNWPGLAPGARRACRYIRLGAEAGAARLDDAAFDLEHYPARRVGHFECSDPLLNRIWSLCEYTTLLCMQRYYEDGLKRDGLLWIGDYRVQFLCAWPLFGDAALARRSLCMIAASQRPDGAVPACAAVGGGHQHPGRIDYMGHTPHDFASRWILDDYIADYLCSLADYALYAGDLQTARNLWPSALRAADCLMDRLQRFDPAAQANPFDLESIAALHQPLLQQALRACKAAGPLARWLADEPSAERFEATAAAIRDRILADRMSPAGLPLPDRASCGWMEVTQSILAGLGGPREWGPWLDHVGSEPPPYDGYERMWQMAALMEAGRGDRALEQMRQFWGIMLACDATTAWERLDLQPPGRLLDWDKPLTSRCHGWSAGANYLLPRYVLGIQPLTPGFGQVAIEPRLHGLRWARGIMPTPHGHITVEIDEHNARVTVPDGVVRRKKGQEPFSTVERL
jgi:hypothetical protein